MAEVTGIAWCDHTFNPWIGCSAVSIERTGGGGCDHCYAKALVENRMGKDFATRWRTSPGNWKEPLKWDRKAAAAGARRLVFCASLADVFDNEVPVEWRRDLFALIYKTPNLTWLLLTKRIGNAERMMRETFGFSEPSPGCFTPRPNVWLGASVVNQAEAERDIPKLLQTPAALRFISYEPALGPVDFERYFEQYPDHNGVLVVQNDNGIDWLIVGGESSQGGAKARPFDRSWARNAIWQCHAARVPCFVKQLGSNVVAENGPGGVDVVQPRYRDRAGADLDEWPPQLKVQEFPA